LLGLIQDLKLRGLYDETLVIWAASSVGPFTLRGLEQGKLWPGPSPALLHHVARWRGARPGTIYGETDDFSYNIVKDPVHIHDFHATVLHLLGFDHERFTVSTRPRSATDRRDGPREGDQGAARLTRAATRPKAAKANARIGHLFGFERTQFTPFLPP